MNDVLHSTLCKTPSIFNLSSSTTNCSFPSTCTLKIWQDDRYGPHLPWTRIRASVERSKTASGISSMLPTHTRRLLQINTWGPSSSFVFRGPIMAKIDPASAPIFNIRSICARISPCPDNDIAPQLCNWRENISTINQPKGSDIGVESKPGKTFFGDVKILDGSLLLSQHTMSKTHGATFHSLSTGALDLGWSDQKSGNIDPRQTRIQFGGISQLASPFPQ